ncbi:FkbM family methyltransferase [Mesorhizobium sp.]|uniref:FkbM family methyltransferase n=1 Tax=Mesorhizobium sp. TaxID=1871066 RepID=UPI00257AEEF5|nr:FkbM family methyltransferase [Mesorhizobium sp.]
MSRLLDNLPLRPKARIKNFGRRLGLDIHVYGPRHNADLRLVHFLRMHAVDLVIDVGANRGQFAKGLLTNGYSGRLVSFEPLPNAHTQLIAEAKTFEGQWEVAPAMALSDEAGFAEFQITHSDTSSSLLQPTDAFVSVLPQVAISSTLEIQTQCLDTAALPYISKAAKPFLKLDVQGTERKVLDGGGETLSKCCGAIVEICTEELYHGQSTIQEVLAVLLSAGFEVWDISSAYRNARTHRLGAIDITCFRP